MFEELLSKNEGKTLEFKENTLSLNKIVQTVIAFANTAGGTIVVGVRDATKEVIGLNDILQDEEKISNSIAMSIEPLLIPTIQFYTWRGRDVLIISVAHAFGPYYLKAKGLEDGTFVRVGSTNRIADAQKISEIKQLRENKHFDELPNVSGTVEDIDFNLIKELFSKEGKKFTEQNAKSFGLIVPYHEKRFPSNAALLLFSPHHTDFFPDAIILMGRFAGKDKTVLIDGKTLDVPISKALDLIVSFIKRHTSVESKITSLRRKDTPEYSDVVLREAITNALLHADYSIRGAHINIAIFPDRIEITNPGTLPFGLNMEAALSGISQLRNRIIGRVFKELNIIEQWGSGLGRMIKICEDEKVAPPKFEELANFFRVTIYSKSNHPTKLKDWQDLLIKYLQKNTEISAKQAQDLWKITPRSTTARLKSMVDNGFIVEISTSSFDPHKTFRLQE